MVNIDKLRAMLVMKHTSVEDVATAAGMNRSTMYRKIKQGGGQFTIEEVIKMASFLSLTTGEVNEIFFAQYVA